MGLSRRLRVRGSERPGRAPELFPALCANAPPNLASGAKAVGIFADPCRDFARGPHALFSNAPGRSCLSLPAQPDAVSAWRAIRAELQRLVGNSAYEIWLAPIELDSFDGDVLMLRAPQATEKWLAGRFGPVLERCVRQILGTHTRVAFAGAAQRRTMSPNPGASGPTAHRPSSTPATDSSSSSSARATAWPTPPPSPSPSSPARPTTRSSSTRPPGLGKTHLLHAIGNYVLDYGGGATVRYTTAEAFTNHFISALSTKSTRRLQARLPRRRRPPHRRHPVPRQQGPHRGGVLPHVQRAV